MDLFNIMCVCVHVCILAHIFNLRLHTCFFIAVIITVVTDIAIIVVVIYNTCSMITISWSIIYLNM